MNTRTKFQHISALLKEQKTNIGTMIGLADKKHFTEKDADPNELSMGIEVEKEHTSDPSIAKKIALDHLSEIKDYYSRLDKMEKEAKGIE